MNNTYVHDVNWFLNNRKEQYDCANKVVNSIKEGNKIININAPVKSGKKDIAICIKKLSDNYKHIYITSLKRKDTKIQLEELTKYGFENANQITNNNVLNLSKQFKSIKSKTIIHFDESDYGTETESLMSNLYKNIIENNNIHLVCYSATNEELEMSEITNVIEIPFIPHKSYRGAKYFIDNNLCKKAEKFYDSDKNHKNYFLSIQAKMIMNDFINQNKQILVVRLAVPNIKNIVKSISQELFNDFNINKIISVDADNKFDWTGDDEKIQILKTTEHKEKKIIIFINQTCTRSTEVGFHDMIYAWHDFRSDESTYNTLLQAYGRVFHYDKYSTNSDIILYADEDVLKANFDFVIKEQLERKLSSRITNFANQYKWQSINLSLNDIQNIENNYTSTSIIDFIKLKFNIEICNEYIKEYKSKKQNRQTLFSNFNTSKRTVVDMKLSEPRADFSRGFIPQKTFDGFVKEKDFKSNVYNSYTDYINDYKLLFNNDKPIVIYIPINKINKKTNDKSLYNN